jgi:hypothetical protein
MKSTTYKIIGLSLLFELIAIFSTKQLANSHLQSGLGLFTSQQIILFGGLALYFWLAQHKTKYYKKKTNKLNQQGVIIFMVAFLFIYFVSHVWRTNIFPDIMNYSLKHYGTNELAVIDSYQKIYNNSTQTDDNLFALYVRLSYHDRLSTIKILKTDPAFTQVLTAAENKGYEIPVHFLGWIPGVVQPKANLGLPNSDNVKPSNASSSLLPSFSLPVPQLGANEVTEATAIAEQFLSDLEKGNNDAAYELETVPFRSEAPRDNIPSAFNSFYKPDFVRKFSASGPGITADGDNYLSLVYTYKSPKYSNPVYVKVWVIHYQNNWAIGFFQDNDKPLTAN